MSNRITDIKNNLERIKNGCSDTFNDEELLDLCDCGDVYNEVDGYGLYLCKECKTELKTTLTENIKEADAMIDELQELLRLVEYNNDYCQGIETKLEDWQNLKKELESLK